MKYNFCTYFNSVYLVKGLTLYASIKKHHQNFTLYVLSFDDLTTRILTQLNLKGLKIISLHDFEDPKLKKAKQNRSLVEFFLTCTPSLPLYILKKYPRLNHITYVDADMFFFANAAPAFTELKNGSMYTVEHRFPSLEKSREKTAGHFNVGFQIFGRNKETLACLNRWRSQTLAWCHFYYEDGKFGDQKYLDEWPSLYKKLVVSRHLGVNTAPWNVSQYSVKSVKSQIFINEFPLIIYHFHQFDVLGPDNFEFSPSYNLKKEVIDLIYKPYAQETLNSISSLQKIDPSFEIRSYNKTPAQLIQQTMTKYFGPSLWIARTIFRKFMPLVNVSH